MYAFSPPGTPMYCIVHYITVCYTAAHHSCTYVELGEGVGGGVCVCWGQLIQTYRSSPDMIIRQTKQNGILETHLWNPEKNFKMPKLIELPPSRVSFFLTGAFVWTWFACQMMRYKLQRKLGLQSEVWDGTLLARPHLKSCVGNYPGQTSQLTQ